MGRTMYRQTREVDNPMLTDGLAYSDLRNAHLKVTVEENATTRIGGLAFIRPANPRKAEHQPGRRYPHHERAAEMFKSDYEALFGSGVPALDNSRPVVDRSPVSHDAGMAGRIDRGRRIIALLQGYPATEARPSIPPQMAKAQADRIIACVVLGISCAEQSDAMPSGQANQRQVGRCVDETLAALDELAEIWGITSNRRAA